MTITTAGSDSATIRLDRWSFRRGDGSRVASVRLPHDAMIGERRGPDSPGGADAGWFHGGHYEYETVWSAPADDGSFAGLFFEGVQGDSVVYVNDREVGRIHNGYAETELPIRDAVVWDADNIIRVDVDNEKQPNSRWYSGAGLYRPVHVRLRPATRFTEDGVRFRTLSIGARARAEVAFEVINPAQVPLRATFELRADGTEVAHGSVSGNADVLTLEVPEPRL